MLDLSDLNDMILSNKIVSIGWMGRFFYEIFMNLPVAQKPSSFRDTLASALALISPDINMHSACCVSILEKTIVNYNTIIDSEVRLGL